MVALADSYISWLGQCPGSEFCFGFAAALLAVGTSWLLSGQCHRERPAASGQQPSLAVKISSRAQPADSRQFPCFAQLLSILQQDQSLLTL